jgi:putative membrane protein
MLSTVVLPWVHYVSILMMAGGLVAQLYLLKLKQTPETVRLLPRVDLFYGINATVVLVTGLARMYHGGKGAEWYWANGLMHGVIGLFVLAFLISLVPTVRFRRWSGALQAGGALPDEAAVRKTRPLIHIQLTIITLITLMITMVARGYGYHGGGGS